MTHHPVSAERACRTSLESAPAPPCHIRIRVAQASSKLTASPTREGHHVERTEPSPTGHHQPPGQVHRLEKAGGTAEQAVDLVRRFGQDLVTVF